MWCGLSANLGCRSETCCTRLAENTGCKKSPKIRHLRTIAQLCRAISLQLRQVSIVGKKLVKHQYLPHVCVSQTLRRGTSNGITELSPPISGWAAIMFGIGPHSSLLILHVEFYLSFFYIYLGSPVGIHMFPSKSLENAIAVFFTRQKPFLMSKHCR